MIFGMTLYRIYEVTDKEISIWIIRLYTFLYINVWEDIFIY